MTHARDLTASLDDNFCSIECCRNTPRSHRFCPATQSGQHGCRTPKLRRRFGCFGKAIGKSAQSLRFLYKLWGQHARIPYSLETKLIAAPIEQERFALVVAHPGHELVVHGWLETARPLVLALTDGSGRSGRGRVESSVQIIESAGARVDEFFGVITDAEAYEALLRGSVDLFVSLTIRLAQRLIDEKITTVVGDAAEGINPVHDVCRVMINAAVAMASESGRTVRNLEFLLFRAHEVSGDRLGERDIHLTLVTDAHARKLSVARAYHELTPEVTAALNGTLEVLHEFPDLASLVDKTVSTLSADAYRSECLRTVVRQRNASQPFYELYGERLVAAGRYAEVLRYQTHVLPIEDALGQLALGT